MAFVSEAKPTGNSSKVAKAASGFSKVALPTAAVAGGGFGVGTFGSEEFDPDISAVSWTEVVKPTSGFSKSAKPTSSFSLVAKP